MIAMEALFQKSDLIPVIVQDADSREVLMLAWADAEAVRRTLRDRTAWFWSRSRQCYWHKGETSGNYMHLVRALTDCDTDTLLLLCRPDGPACHTGARSCFFNEMEENV